MQALIRTLRRPSGKALACSLCLAGPAMAAPTGWHPVSGAELERLRGGFTTDSGLALSLGIERLVTINGQLVSRTSFQIGDLKGLTIDQLRETSAALSAIKLIQIGSGSVNSACFSSDTPGGTVIQNTLSNQQIESRTVINASVNSLGLLKAINFNGSVDEAVARVAGNR